MRCRLLREKPDILMLDELTNHLNPVAKDELKRALKAYRGGILLISHERGFNEEIATKIWDMSELSTLI